MTQFEEIKQALIELGWQMEEGRGDHAKFFLPGNRRPVTISRSISGRAYQNKIANIRKIDPRFSLGKQKNKKREDADNDVTAETSEPIAKYDYIQVGKMVRYTMPERKDFSKLAVADSAMNIPYVVEAISSGKQVCNENDIITIKYEDHSINVTPKDLDAWEVRKCTSCGMKFPVNCFHDEPNMCDSCAKEARKKAEAMIKASMAQPSKEIKIQNDELVPDIVIPMKMKEEEGQSTSERLASFLSQSREMDKMVAKIYKKVPKDKAEVLKRSQEDVESFRFLVDNEDIEKPTLAKIKKAMVLYVNLAYNHDDSGLMMPHWDKPRGPIEFDYAYSVRTIGGVNEYIVNVKDKDCLYIAVTEIGLLYHLVKKLFKENFIIRIVCDAESYDQYTVFPELAEDAIKMLNEKYPEDELKGRTEFLERYAALHPTQVDDLIKETLQKETEDWELSSAMYPTAVTPDNRIDVLAYNSQPQLFVLLTFDENLPDKEKRIDTLKNAVNELLKKTADICGGENVIFGFRTNFFFNAVNCDKSAVTEIKYDIASFCEVCDSLLSIANDICTKVKKHNISAAELFRTAIDSWENSETGKPEERPAKENPQTNMNMENSLDNTNPSSENKVLAEITTRELLKELRDRGVQFENLTIPVVTRMTVSLDQI